MVPGPRRRFQELGKTMEDTLKETQRHETCKTEQEVPGCIREINTVLNACLQCKTPGFSTFIRRDCMYALQRRQSQNAL